MSPVSGAVTGQWRNGRYCVCVSMRDWGQSVVREAAAAEWKRPGVGVQVGVQADAANLLHETSTSKNSENEPELRETDGSDGTATASPAHLFFHVARRKTMALSKTQLYCRSLPRAVDSKVSANHLSACLYMLMTLFARIPSTETAECTRDIR